MSFDDRADAGELVAFGDNPCLGTSPLPALRGVPGEATAGYAQAYRADLAARRGVIITAPLSASGTAP